MTKPPPSDAPDSARRRLLAGGTLAAGAALLAPFARAARSAPAGAIGSADYLALDATAMAEAVRRRQLSGSELMAAAMARCDAVNPRVNAVVMRHDERVRALLAKGAGRSGPLAGVPMLIKDLHTHLAGTLTTNGSRLFRDAAPSERSSTIVERYEAAGSLVFGKTSSPEFGLTTTTESRQWGQTRNPWNLAHSAGGSSGGAAAAVAAGIIPAAHATDGGGSIRIPASYCGLFGLKPSRYRTPSGPQRFEGWFGASVGHVVSRSVRDSALLLDVGQGHEPGSPYWSAPLERPFVAELKRAPGKLRVALVSEALTGTPLDPQIRRTLDDTVRLLLGLGHEVEAARFGLDPRALFGAHGAVVGAALLATVRDREQQLGRAFAADELETVTQHILRTGGNVTGEGLYRARQGFESITMTMESTLAKYDVILSPVTATLTPVLGALSLDQPYDTYARAAAGSAAFTIPANLGGQPSMSVPLGWSDEGLPIGMLFTARIGAEGLLFRLAAQLERERPWAQRRAPLA
ncbi:amidase [Massilia niastensis]|uniref:amidase n=1 Tax=Massilia niastensis TaxID=544911 RepID=UPI00037DC66A|nr:amidase [Massilia niastensis]